MIDRINTPRKEGGLGEMKIPLVADLTKTISKDYGVLKEDDGIAYRWGRLRLLVSLLQHVSFEWLEDTWQLLALL